MPLTREEALAIAESRPIKPLPSHKSVKADKKSEQPHSGPDWFNMPAPEMTPELKDDIRLLSLRSALDPKRFYKKGDRVVTSRFLQVGTVVNDASSYYTDRSSRKQRAAPTIVDSLLRDVQRKQYLKRKYGELEAASMRNGRHKRSLFKKKK